MGEYGRAVVCGDNEQKDTAGEFGQCKRAGKSDTGVYKKLE
jgi:hypothetical protein